MSTRGQGASTTSKEGGNDGKPSDAGQAPAGTQAQTQAPAPPQEPVLEPQNGPAATPGSPKLEWYEAKQINQTTTTQAKSPPAAPALAPATPAQNATTQPALATSVLPSTAEVNPGEPKQQPPRPSTARARTREAAPANLEQPSYAQSTGEASAPDTGGKSSRSRYAATEERQSASVGSKQKTPRIFDWLFR
jgi:hypothetical protein